MVIVGLVISLPSGRDSIEISIEVLIIGETSIGPLNKR